MLYLDMVAKSPIPTNLSRWQKKYGRGFIMYSLKTGKVVGNSSDYKELIQESKKRKVKRDEVSVIYLPDVKSVSIFPLSV